MNNDATILTSTTQSIRKIPVNFIDADHLLFAHELCKNIDPVFRIALKNLLVTNDAHIIEKKGIVFIQDFLKTASIGYLSSGRFYCHFFKMLVRGHLNIVSKPVIFIIEKSNLAYFHWMTEVIPRLIAGGEPIRNFTLVLPGSYRQNNFISQSLEILGFNYLYFTKDYYYLKNAYYITHFASPGNFHDYFIQKIRSAFTDIKMLDLPEKCIFISRRKANYRKINNEQALYALLVELKFEIVYCEDLSLQDQILLFSRTKVLVSNHGAGLTNMLFMQKGTSVLECRCNNDSHNNCYFALSSSLGINYYYQQCFPVNAGEDPHIADINVDEEQLRKTLFDILLTEEEKTG